MPHELTHASFFSGAGGLDLGLERAGWRTVSFSEIDPYASAVLAERWPGVPNLGDVLRVAAGEPGRASDGSDQPTGGRAGSRDPRWQDAELWTGGFPCQDLSVAGKRRGLAGSRSGLAFSFLELVGRHRPRFVLLENVPGLLSSHAGRDFGTLLARLGELGYGWAYRVLDTRHFGVPQRRRRVFILGIHARIDPSGERAAEVLSVGARCPRHPATGHQAGPGASGVVADGATTARTVQSAFGHHGWTLGAQDVDGGYLQLGSSPDAGRDGATDGLAGRPHDRDDLAKSLLAKGNSSHAEDLDTYIVANAVRASDGHHGHGSPRGDGSDNLVPVAFAQNQRGELRISETAFQLTAGGGKPSEGYSAVLGTSGMMEDPLLPLGLDSHRYRCCGNGVVSGVAEWIGLRLAAELADHAA